jgi:hypothetical protein
MDDLGHCRNTAACGNELGKLNLPLRTWFYSTGALVPEAGIDTQLLAGTHSGH